MMKTLVEYLVKSLVDRPEAVVLEEHANDAAVTLELRVAPEDLGKVIGKHGNTINAIRVVLQAAASSRKQRVKLDIIGSDGPLTEAHQEPTEAG
jgi:hypothetical protein